MEMGEYENMVIGEKQPVLEAKEVVVITYIKRDVENKDKKHEKLVLVTNHPEGKQLEIGKVKYLQENQVCESGLWLHLDRDGKLPYKGAVSCMLRYYNVKTIKELIGKKINTVVDDKGYLIVKAY